jgi:hypothetical protein
MHQGLHCMAQTTVLGRWIAKMAKVGGLSRAKDKNELFALVLCGLMLGRNFDLRTKRLRRGR